MKCPASSISVPRGPTGEPGGDSLAGTFWKKIYLGSFLGPRGYWDFKSGGHLGTLVKGQGSPELILDYGAQRAIRSRCVGTVRARTQCKSISLWGCDCCRRTDVTTERTLRNLNYMYLELPAGDASCLVEGLLLLSLWIMVCDLRFSQWYWQSLRSSWIWSCVHR